MFSYRHDLLETKAKKSRIRETKHLSTDADSSTDTTVGWTKNSRKPKFFEKRKKSSKTQKLKNIQRYAKISDIPFDQRPLIHREAWFPPCFVRQNQQKNKLFFARRFQTTSKQKCLNVTPLLSITFPQGFRISKNIGHPTSGSGGKKTVKRYLKGEQTHKQTDGHFDLQKASAQRADALKTKKYMYFLKL